MMNNSNGNVLRRSCSRARAALKPTRGVNIWLLIATQGQSQFPTDEEENEDKSVNLLGVIKCYYSFHFHQEPKHHLLLHSSFYENELYSHQKFSTARTSLLFHSAKEKKYIYTQTRSVQFRQIFF
jgi:hypothetical protein